MHLYHFRIEPWGAILSHPDLWMCGVDNFKTATEETKSIQNMFFEESAKNIIESKVITCNNLTRKRSKMIIH